MTISVIDNFSTGIYLQAITANTFTYLEVAEVFKQFRKIEIAKGDTPALYMGITNGFTFQSAALQSSLSTLKITYDGNGSAAAVDLSAYSKFKIDIASQTNQNSGAKLSISVFDGTNTATVNQDLPDNSGGVTIEGASYNFNFAAFSGINFSVIQSLKLEVVNVVGGYVAGAINLNSFEAV